MSEASARHATLARREGVGRLEAVRLAVRYAEAGTAQAEDGRPIALSLEEAPLRAGASSLGPLVLHCAVDAEGDSARIELLVHNASERPIQVESVVAGFRWAGAPDGPLRFLRNGWQSWSFSASRELDLAGEPVFPSGSWLRGMHHGLGEPPADRRGWHESDLLSVVGTSTSGACCLAGVLEDGRSTGVVFLRRDAGGVRIEVELCLETPLAPGEERALEPVRLALGTDASALLESHAVEHGMHAGARVDAPFQAGWCSWYHFFHDVTEDDFLRNLDALASLRTEIPIDVVQLDDGYQRAIGDWLETNEKFPRGLAPLARAVRDAGFRPGIWTAPFCVAPESRLLAERRGWLLRRGDELHPGLVHPEWSSAGPIYALDTSQEAVRGHLMRTFAALVGMGFSYQKLDFLFVAGARARAADPTRSRAERLALGLDAIREGAGPDAFVLGCGCPLGAAVGRVDGMRIGPDVAPFWAPDPKAGVPGFEPTGPSVRNAIRNVVSRAWMHRRLWLNDPDCLMARTRDTELGEHEVRSLAALLATSGGMLVFSDDVPALSEHERARVGEALRLAREVDAAAARGTARAPGLLAAEIPSSFVSRTASRALLTLLNAEEAPREVAIDLDGLELRVGEGAPQTLLGSAAPVRDGRRIGAQLLPHESVFVRLPGDARLAVFCDFDGTFAVQDVGSTIARRFAGDRRAALWTRLESGELDAWSYNMALLDGLELPESELDAFLRTVELMPGARELVAWCEAHQVPFRVLSDGFDRNLDRLQELHGVRFAYDANRLWYQAGRWRIAPSHPDPSCHCGTGVCKRARIGRFREAHPAAVVVHVGNGRVSDLCAALAADVVFAKDSLAEALEERGERFEHFESLHDVIQGLERLDGRDDPAASPVSA